MGEIKRNKVWVRAAAWLLLFFCLFLGGCATASTDNPDLLWLDAAGYRPHNLPL